MRTVLLTALFALGAACSGSGGPAAAALRATAVAIEGANNHYGTIVRDDGSFVVAGDSGADELVFHSAARAPVVESTNGGQAHYLAAYDASLDLLWTRILSGDVEFRELLPAPGGTFALLCEIYESAMLDGAMIDVGAQTKAALLLRYSHDGQLLGITHLAHGGPDTSECAYGADGSLYVAMRTRQGLTLDPLSGDPLEILTAANTWDLHVVRYEPGGARAWVRSAVADVALWPTRILATSDGDCVVGASYYANGTFFPGTADEVTPPTASDYRGVLFRLDGATGALEWFHDLEGRVSVDCLRDAGDGVVASGDFRGAAAFGAGQPGERMVDSPDHYAGFVARYADDGTFRWVRLVTDSAEGAYAATVDVAANGTLVVTGSGREDTTFEGGARPDVRGQIAKPFVATYDPDGNLRQVWTGETAGWASANDGVLAPDGALIVNGDHEEEILLPGGVLMPAFGMNGGNFMLKLPLD